MCALADALSSNRDVHGVELGDCGVHVFEVEPDLQRDPTLLVNAVYLEKFVLRRPGAHVGSAQRHSSESQALASHGDDDMVRSA